MPRCCVLDVGHGNAAVLFGDAQTVVVDAGPRSHLIKFLEDQKVTRVDAILVSHADADHVGGLMALLSKARKDSAFTIGRICVNPDPREGQLWNDDVSLVRAYDLYKEGKLEWNLSIGEGDPPAFDAGGCEVEVIAPSKALRASAVGGKPQGAKRASANTLSAVVQIRCNGTPWILLPGDLDLAGLNHLTTDGRDVTAPVVVFPHHGGMAGTLTETESMVVEFLKRARPATVIFSAKSGSAKFPSSLVVRTILGSASPPAICSVGRSVALDAALRELTDNPHRNNMGSITVSAPSATESVRIYSV